jgi:hypothetical protein
MLGNAGVRDIPFHFASPPLSLSILPSLDFPIETAGKAPFVGHVAATDRDPRAISYDGLASL